MILDKKTEILKCNVSIVFHHIRVTLIFLFLRFVHPYHGITSAVEQNVGNAIRVWSSHKGLEDNNFFTMLFRFFQFSYLSCRLNNAVVTVQPVGITGVVYISHIVTLGGFTAVVINNSEQLIK